MSSSSSPETQLLVPSPSSSSSAACSFASYLRAISLALAVTLLLCVAFFLDMRAKPASPLASTLIARHDCTPSPADPIRDAAAVPFDVRTLPGYKYEFSVFVSFRNEAPMLHEWLEYHLLIGVDHFYMYDHYHSTDGSREILAPYIACGLVTLREWESAFGHVVSQYNDAIAKARGETKWLAMMDSDEFLTIVEPGWDVGSYFTAVYSTEPLPDAADAPGVEPLIVARQNALARAALIGFNISTIGSVSVQWLMFGTSHVPKVPADRLWTEMLTRCASQVPTPHSNLYSKSVVRPDRVEGMYVQEACNTRPGYVRVAGDERYQLMLHNAVFEGKTVPVHDVSKVRLNHYWSRDLDFMINVKIPRRAGLVGQGAEQSWKEANAADESADYIILRHAEELRWRLGMPRNGVSSTRPTLRVKLRNYTRSELMQIAARRFQHCSTNQTDVWRRFDWERGRLESEGVRPQ